MSDGVQRGNTDHGQGGEPGGIGHTDEGQDDSALKTLQAITKSSKMLKAGHALADKQSIQKRFAGAPGPTSLYRCASSDGKCILGSCTLHPFSTDAELCCSHPSFSLFKLVGMEALGPPRAALFDIDEKFMHAIPVNVSSGHLSAEDLGALVSEPEKPVAPAVLSPKAHHKQEKHAKKEKKEKKVCTAGLIRAQQQRTFSALTHSSLWLGKPISYWTMAEHTEQGQLGT